LAKQADWRGNEALRDRIVNLRQSHHRHIDPVRGDGGGRLFRRSAGMLVRTNDGIVFLGRLTGHGIGDWSCGGQDQRPVGAFESRAERLDHTAIVLTVRYEFREVMVEGQVDDAVRSGGSPLEAVQVLKRSASDLGSSRRQTRRLVIRTTEAENLMTGGNQVFDNGRADETGGAGNKHTHEQSLQVERRPLSVRGQSW
jgi:hypothetical protein